MKKLFTVLEVRNRKCPLTRRRCMVDGCALWANEGLRHVHGSYYQGLLPVGYCTLGRGR